MNATPKCQKCRKANADVLADVESPRECQSAEMYLCYECVELADGLGCYVDIIAALGTPENADDVLDPNHDEPVIVQAATQSRGYAIPYPAGVREPNHTGRNCAFVGSDREPNVCAECARIVAESK